MSHLACAHKERKPSAKKWIWNDSGQDGRIQTIGKKFSGSIRSHINIAMSSKTDENLCHIIKAFNQYSNLKPIPKFIHKCDNITQLKYT